MAVHLYCQGCKTDNPITEKQCKKCGTPFPSVGRKYRVRVKRDGQTVNRFTHSIKVAREIEDAIEGDLQRGKYGILKKRRTITLAEFWERYLPWAKSNKKTWKNDQGMYDQHLKPTFGHLPMDKITPLSIERLKSDLKKAKSRLDRPYSPATIKHVLVIIRRLFNLARKWGLYDGQNPMERVSMPKVDNTVVRFLTAAELGRLQATLNKWPCKETVAIIRFAMLTGFRRGEIVGLKWAQVDMDNGYVTLSAPKGGKTVSVPVSDAAMDVLRSRERKSNYVFPGRDGRRRYEFAGPWKRVLADAKIENFRFHDFRHNFASQLASGGVPVSVIQQLLTHKQIATTMKYAHLSPGALQDAAQRSAKLITGTGDVVEMERRQNGNAD